jgi:hypothetical protein
MRPEPRAFHHLKYMIALGLLVQLNGCVPVPGTATYFEHDMAVSVDGRRFDFKRYFECSQTMEFSEGDGKLHPRWNRSGAGFATADIGGDRVLVYSITGDCESDHQVFQVAKPEKLDPYTPDAVRVLDNARDPQKLYVLTGRADGFPVQIDYESTRRIDPPTGGIGAPKAELALKETVRDSQHGFQRVSARVIPLGVWAQTDAARQYFSQLKTVTVARVGEAPPISGWADSFVQFPFYRERNYQKGVNGEIVGLSELDTIYDGEAFNVNDSAQPGVQTWYATRETRENPKLNNEPVAVVNYKGVVFKVKGLQEIYDPATKNILLFANRYTPYPWGAPDSTDVKRLMSGQ